MLAVVPPPLSTTIASAPPPPPLSRAVASAPPPPPASVVPAPASAMEPASTGAAIVEKSCDCGTIPFGVEGLDQLRSATSAPPVELEEESGGGLVSEAVDGLEQRSVVVPYSLADGPSTYACARVAAGSSRQKAIVKTTKLTHRAARCHSMAAPPIRS